MTLLESISLHIQTRYNGVPLPTTTPLKILEMELY